MVDISLLIHHFHTKRRAKWVVIVVDLQCCNTTFPLSLKVKVTWSTYCITAFISFIYGHVSLHPVHWVLKSPVVAVLVGNTVSTHTHSEKLRPGTTKATACPLLVPPLKGHCMIYAPALWVRWELFVLWGTWPIETWNMKMKFRSWIDLQGWARIKLSDCE